MSDKSKKCCALMLLMFLCIPFARPDDKPPVVAFVPFHAAGVSQEEVELFSAMLAKEFEVGGGFSVVQRGDVSALIEMEQAVKIASELGADFIVTGKLFAFGDSHGAFITMFGVNPAVAVVAARQEEGMDALMATMPGLCAELLESTAHKNE
ncbi:MAG: hypothetical protein J1E59_06730 [Treponema sp.]|nr:hypothetical protein [Treponema sp.]